MKRMMTLLPMLFLMVPLVYAEQQSIVEIDVTGMTCPFCVYGTEKNLGNLPGVEQVVISLAKKKARIVMAPGRDVDLDAIKRAIVKAGFTPGEVSTRVVEVP